MSVSGAFPVRIFDPVWAPSYPTGPCQPSVWVFSHAHADVFTISRPVHIPASLHIDPQTDIQGRDRHPTTKRRYPKWTKQNMVGDLPPCFPQGHGVVLTESSPAPGILLLPDPWTQGQPDPSGVYWCPSDRLLRVTHHGLLLERIVPTDCNTQLTPLTCPYRCPELVRRANSGNEWLLHANQ